MTGQPNTSPISNAPLLCECGHGSRSHGPRLGEHFHTRCWFCPCDQFIAIDLDPDDIVGTVEVAEALQVSQSWVRRHSRELGGEQSTQGRRLWQFYLKEALEWGKRLIALSSLHPTVITECPACGGRTITKRGRFGWEVVYAYHLPGMCQ